jgi:hypothetical protein
MLIDEYLHGVIVRERMAEARERAAIDRLMRVARQERTRTRHRPLQRLFHLFSSRWIHRLISGPPWHLEGWR